MPAKQSRRSLAPTEAAPIRALVGVKPAGTDTHDAEVAELTALASLPGNGLLGVMLPKAEDPGVAVEMVGRLHAARTDLTVVTLIESAAGVLAAADIALVPGVTRLALGAIVLMADVNANLDSPATAIKDSDLVESRARAARACGLGGKLCMIDKPVIDKAGHILRRAGPHRS